MANSSYAVQGRVEVSISINGTPFPLDTMNLLHFLQIGWTTYTKVPTCHFAISDAQHSLDKLGLPDGIPIQITIKPYGSTTQIYNFRKFNHVKTFNGKCFSYEIDAYFDNPLYWTGTTTGGFRGTSSDLMAEVARRCGLNYAGVPTSDSQLWLPRNRTYGEWVSSVASRAYADPTSYMVAGIDPTANGTLIFQNVNALRDSSTKVVLGQTIQGSLTCMDYSPIATSGAANKFQGYQHTRYDQTAVSANSNQALQQLTFTPDVSGYYINDTISKKITQGYRSFSGVDVGNTHPQYEQALYQNRRLASTYSMSVEFLMLTPSAMTLLNKFSFSVDTETQKQDVPYAGTYTVAAKAIFIQGTTYAEKILGVRQGVMSTYVSA